MDDATLPSAQQPDAGQPAAGQPVGDATPVSGGQKAPPVAQGVPQPSNGSSTAEIISAVGAAHATQLNSGAENVSTIARPDGTVEASASRSPPRSPPRSPSSAAEAAAPAPIVVSATGKAGLPSTQAEVDTRRAARLAKQASGIVKRSTKKASAQHQPGDGWPTPIWP